MKIGGIIAAAAVLVAAAAGVTTWALWSSDHSTAQPTSEQIKASAQAHIDRSIQDGRKAQYAILQLKQTPTTELCHELWDRKTPAERGDLLKGMWIHGCADAPQ
ncbi:putative ribosomally synthesized peptide with SipW-like signal peptide [Streptomyces sp. 3212.3]|uniref:hypothetical protein n=1 Tax=Streptomyces sp. 3212.3 TaxID=1938846 RepID=UPI000E262FEF|nr:hypothetical protein [Streptomyces sp. 3212.3]REE61406.1 putative ribosomally synthesized peptide with SipW-like signal peptide [Streptomyces sp. 3212.3]